MNFLSFNVNNHCFFFIFQTWCLNFIIVMMKGGSCFVICFPRKMHCMGHSLYWCEWEWLLRTISLSSKALQRYMIEDGDNIFHWCVECWEKWEMHNTFSLLSLMFLFFKGFSLMMGFLLRLSSKYSNWLYVYDEKTIVWDWVFLLTNAILDGFMSLSDWC